MKMKTLLKLTTLAALLAWALPAHAGKFYDLNQGTSSATLRVGLSGVNRTDAVLTSSGAFVAQSTSATSGYAVMRALNYAGVEILKLTQNGDFTTTINGSNLVSATIDTTKLATDSVITAKIINAAVDTAKHATDSVTTVKIINAAVDTAKLATDSVITAKIINAAVDTAKLATDSVTATSILNGTITAAKLNFSVGTGDAVLNSTQTFSGTNTFASNTVKVSSNMIVGTAVGSFVSPGNGIAVSAFGVVSSSTAIPTCGSGVGGATCTMTPGSNNQSGSMTLAGSGTGISLTFSQPGYPNINACVPVMGGSNVAFQQSVLSSATVTWSWGGGVNGKLYYICFGAP